MEYVEGLNAAGWDKDMVERFQTLVSTGPQQTRCSEDDVSSTKHMKRGTFPFYNIIIPKDSRLNQVVQFPEVACPYTAPDQCSDSTPPTCCERITGIEEPTTAGGVVLTASLALLLALSLLTTIMG